jgi:hypothetical protein
MRRVNNYGCGPHGACCSVVYVGGGIVGVLHLLLVMGVLQQTRREMKIEEQNVDMGCIRYHDR